VKNINNDEENPPLPLEEGASSMNNNLKRAESPTYFSPTASGAPPLG